MGRCSAQRALNLGSFPGCTPRDQPLHCYLALRRVQVTGANSEGLFPLSSESSYSSLKFTTWKSTMATNQDPASNSP